MKPIPLNLLVHNVKYKKQTGIDRNRNPIFLETILVNVRLSASFQTVKNNAGFTSSDKLTLFIDATNSKAYQSGEQVALIIPEENDAIECNGKNYTITKVTPCFARAESVHHWEVELE